MPGATRFAGSGEVLGTLEAERGDDSVGARRTCTWACVAGTRSWAPTSLLPAAGRRLLRHPPRAGKKGQADKVHRRAAGVPSERRQDPTRYLIASLNTRGCAIARRETSAQAAVRDQAQSAGARAVLASAPSGRRGVPQESAIAEFAPDAVRRARCRRERLERALGYAIRGRDRRAQRWLRFCSSRHPVRDVPAGPSRGEWGRGPCQSGLGMLLQHLKGGDYTSGSFPAPGDRLPVPGPLAQRK